MGQLPQLAKYKCPVCKSYIYADMRIPEETPCVEKFICPFGCAGELESIGIVEIEKSRFIEDKWR